MPFLLIYILKFSISLAVVFLFYQLVLRRLTFYNWNRIYLLGYSLISFFVPFIDISGTLHQNKLADNEMINWMPVFRINDSDTVTETGLTLWSIISLLLVIGICIMSLRLILQLFSIKRMMNKGIIISDDGLRLYQVNEDIIPFSFGNAVFINKNLHSEEEMEEIIRHEIVHVKQKHSIDIICSELLCIINWFNPFAWLIRRAIRQNLEFIADNKVLDNGIDRKQYQYLLLKVIGNNHFSIAPKFNFSSLKKRIAMMNKLKSAKINLLRFLFVLPLFAVILLSFRKQLGDTTDLRSSREKYKEAVRTDTVPEVTSPNAKGYIINVKDKNGECELVIKDKRGKEVKRMLLTEWNNDADKYEGLYGIIPPPPPPVPPAPPTPPAKVNLPENVQRISVNNEVATVWLKNGEKELYDMKDNNARQVFETKYGKIPPPHPPVPAVQPIPPVAPVVAGSNGLSKVADTYEITDKKAVLHLKSGKTEEYDLTDKKEKYEFEKKYGKIINVNTNINAVIAPVTVVSTHTSPNVVAAPATVAASPVAYITGSGKTVIAPMGPKSGQEPVIVDDYGYTITGNEDILLTITKKTSRNQLSLFIREMKEKGIDLVFDEIEYDTNGNLIKLTGSMKSKDGRSNFVATDFSKLVLAMIRKGEQVYFKVSMKDDKEVI